MIRELVSRNVEKLAKYRTGPECGEETAGYVLDEDVGDGVAKLPSGELVDGHAFFSWSCDESLK